jgi:hypothetical protein
VARGVVIGQCLLCRNQAELRDSHFIPQAAYKLARGVGKSPHPIVLQVDSVVQTSAQVRAHVLCHDCEQCLSQNGEDAFFRYCYRGPGKFKLLHILLSQDPIEDYEEFAVYAVPKSENSVIEQIGYMGLSVLWKSAAYAWKDTNGTISSISLGSPYQEQIRQFLLKAAGFPDNIAIAVQVSDESNRLIAVVGTPATKKWPTHYLHWIDLCGITINLLVGARMPPQIKQLCVLRQGQKCVLVEKRQEAILAMTYHEHLMALARRRMLAEEENFGRRSAEPKGGLRGKRTQKPQFGGPKVGGP